MRRNRPNGLTKLLRSTKEDILSDRREQKEVWRVSYVWGCDPAKLPWQKVPFSLSKGLDRDGWMDGEGEGRDRIRRGGEVRKKQWSKIRARKEREEWFEQVKVKD